MLDGTALDMFLCCKLIECSWCIFFVSNLLIDPIIYVFGKWSFEGRKKRSYKSGEGIQRDERFNCNLSAIVGDDAINWKYHQSVAL